MAKTKTKNPIQIVGRNTFLIGKMKVSANEFNEILKDTQKEIQDFNFNFLINWEEKTVN